MQILHLFFWLTLLATRSFTADAIDIELPRIGLAEVPLEIAVAVAVVVGTIPGGYVMTPWISIVAGAAILVGVLRYLGRKA